MNKIIDALKLAEEALNAMLTHMGMDEDEWTKPTFNQARQALTAIREALTEQAEQEPVQIGWQCAECKAPVRDGYTCDVCDSGLAEERYAAPQPVKQEPVLKVGNLVTINQDPYPALGKLFVQLWDGDDLIARVYANDEETLNKRVSVLNAAPVQQAEQEPEYKGWYCAHCERGVDGSEVTFHEQHEVCGRVITNDVPPKPVMQEPVAWAHPSGGYLSARYMKEFATGLEKETYTIPLYAAPVQQVDLTDDEIFQFQKEIQYADVDPITFARAVIAADREKNK